MPFRAFTLQEMAEAIHPEDRVDVLNTFYHVKTNRIPKRTPNAGATLMVKGISGMNSVMSIPRRQWRKRPPL